MSRGPRDRDDYDEEDDLPRRPPQQEMAGLDNMFLNTNMVVLVLLAICCNGIALILSIIEMVTGKHPVAKKNATTVLIISAIVTALALIINFAGLLGGGMGGGMRR